MNLEKKVLTLSLEPALWEVLRRYCRVNVRFQEIRYKTRASVKREVHLGGYASEILHAALIERADVINEQYEDQLKHTFGNIVYRIDEPIPYKLGPHGVYLPLEESEDGTTPNGAAAPPVDDEYFPDEDEVYWG